MMLILKTDLTYGSEVDPIATILCMRFPLNSKTLNHIHDQVRLC